jgi:aspartyl-tRNA(Asn)/glutamyl-tRNA(Gln) amidotransferase subunit A
VSLAARGVLSDAAGVREGRLDPEALLEASLSAWRASEDGDAPVRAFLALDADLARRHAIRSGGFLAGVPVAVKDNLVTDGLPTTCGSRILEGYRSPFEATAVRRLRAAGAVVLGKTNMDEFGMGSSTEHSAFGPTRNPLDRARVPGGSSGGSAAAVASGIVRAALGSDTGGSIRQPAAFCGVVGIKPTYGAVSRYGLVAYASSLDQVGTFGRTVEDAAALLQAIAGHDPRDSTSASRPSADLLDGMDRGVEGTVIGVPEEYFPEALDPRIAARCREALGRLRAGGAEIREISLGHTALAIPTYYVLATAEASANLARFDGVRYGVRPEGAETLDELYERTRALFGPEVKRRILLGTYVLSSGYHDTYYGRAQRVRALIAADFRTAFAQGVDAVFSPTTPGTAFGLGERTADPVAMYLSDVFTVTANLAGLPALSVPVGTVDGLPVGGQLIGPPWGEPDLVRIARALEADAHPEGG